MRKRGGAAGQADTDIDIDTTGQPDDAAATTETPAGGDTAGDPPAPPTDAPITADPKHFERPAGGGRWARNPDDGTLTRVEATDA